MRTWKRLLLNTYYYGSYPIRRAHLRRLSAEGRAPVTILFYHRVADDGANEWTVSNRMFERQIGWLRKRFELISLQTAQRRLLRGANDRPSVCITFDDGYADNCRAAVPLLVKHRIPCTYFVTLQNVLEGQPFRHDLAKGHDLADEQEVPQPNSLEQLRAMASAGIEIGAHTYSHPDLGCVTDRRVLHREVVEAGRELQQAIGRPVRYFAFPIGQHVNLNREAFQMAYEAGYEAVCSAYGGFNFPGDDAFHLQRVPADRFMIRLKNWTTLDPRKRDVPRFAYDLNPEECRLRLSSVHTLATFCRDEKDRGSEGIRVPPKR